MESSLQTVHCTYLTVYPSIPPFSTLHVIHLCQHTFHILISYALIFFAQLLQEKKTRDDKTKTISSVLYGKFIAYCTLNVSHCTLQVLFTITLGIMYNIYTLLVSIYDYNHSFFYSCVTRIFSSFFTNNICCVCFILYSTYLHCTLPRYVYFHPQSYFPMFILLLLSFLEKEKRLLLYTNIQYKCE